MEELAEIWPSLTQAQKEAIVEVARSMRYAEPMKPRKYLTAAQIEKEYGVKKRTVDMAAQRKVLRYSIPDGCVRGRRFERKDVERWLGIVG